MDYSLVEIFKNGIFVNHYNLPNQSLPLTIVGRGGQFTTKRKSLDQVLYILLFSSFLSSSHFRTLLTFFFKNSFFDLKSRGRRSFFLALVNFLLF